MGARSDPAWAAFLVQPGDLPALQKAGENVIVAAKHSGLGVLFQVLQWFDRVEQDGDIGGQVMLTVYETPEAAQRDYQRVRLPSDRILTDIGEEASMEEASGDRTSTHIIFRRCRAVILVSGVLQLDPTKPRGAFSEESVLKYAQRLDERVRPIVC
jgi:hypothetical protein